MIVPVRAHYLPLKGMTQLMRTNLARATAESLHQNYGRDLYNQVLEESGKIIKILEIRDR